MRYKSPYIIGLFALALGTTVYAANKDPYEMANNSYVNLGGEVISQTGRSFLLDYGDGVITVEMDDYDLNNEAEMINPGEHVTVFGKIDDDLYEFNKIEAESVFVKDRSKFYYANDADEETTYDWHISISDPLLLNTGTWVGVRGEVSDINLTEFTIDNGFRKIRIETSYLDYNPLDDFGYQQIDVGDKVYVTGNLDRNFFKKDEIEAKSIITLKDS